MEVSSIIQEVGVERIQAICSVSRHSIRAAKRDSIFPASWYGVLKPECDRLGIDCPMSLFSFKQPPEGPSDAKSEDAS